VRKRREIAHKPGPAGDEEEEVAVTTIRVTIDETIQANRAEDALHGLSYRLVLTPGSAARERQASSRESLHRLAVPSVMTADEAKYLEAAVVVLGGGERQRRNARYLYAHRHEPSDIYVTDDLTLFGGKDDERRRRLATLFETQIMTLEELKQFCDERRKT
jgi:hypothetical protein